MPLILVTAPASAPVTLAEAKANSRVTTTAEDALITSLIDAATQDAEHVMGRAIITQQWKLVLDAFDERAQRRDTTPVYTSAQQWRPMQDVSSGALYLRRPIVTAINSVKYLDATTGTQLTMPSTDYTCDIGAHLVSRLVPAYGKTWPATLPQIGAVEVLFTCGWANAAAVPQVIKNWILQRVSALYENREAWTAGKVISLNPDVDRLLARWRARSF